MEKPEKAPAFKPLGRSEWEQHFKTWEASGLSRSEYCRRKGLSYYAFNYWKKRISKPSSSPPINLVRLDDVRPRDSSLPESPSGAPIRLWISGIRMEIESNLSSTELTRLVKALKRV